MNTDDIWEVRIQTGVDAIRLLGFLDRNTFVVLTNGFFKKQQKTPSQEIRLAERRKHEYLLRKEMK